MSILARFSPPSMTSEQYDAIVKRLYEEGVHPAEGLELEVAFGSGDQMKVSILFDSMEAFQAFGERIGPIINEMGDKLSGIIDLTISYAPNHCSLKNFFTGKVTKVRIDYDVIPLTPDLLGDFENDRAYRKHLQAWLNDRWAQKDQLLQGQHE